MDWSLYRCGRVGHITYAPDEPHLREHLSGQTAAEADLWQCLRCGTYITGGPHGSGPVDAAPAVRRGKQIRSDVILRLFAIERGLRFFIFGALAYGIWRFSNSQSIAQAINRDLPIIRTFARQLGFTLNHTLLEKIQSLLHLSSSSLRLLAFGVTGLAVVSAIEAFALWQARRWGEYFAMIVTSLGLPFEIYELSKAVTVTKLALFALNLLLVGYLVYTRHLWGARGGKEAYEAKLRADSVFDEAEQAGAARRSTPGLAEAAAPAAAAAAAAAAPVAAAVPAVSPRNRAAEPATVVRNPTGPS